jgi:hypothetical protein
LFRIRALKNNVQMQAIEYADLQDGLDKMAELYPDCEFQVDDIELEQQQYLARLALEQQAMLAKKDNQ